MSCAKPARKLRRSLLKHHAGQPAVARLERRADMYVSNLRRYIEALGGKLEIMARFPDASVSITNFSELAEPEWSKRPAYRAISRDLRPRVAEAGVGGTEAAAGGAEERPRPFGTGAYLPRHARARVRTPPTQIGRAANAG